MTLPQLLAADLATQRQYALVFGQQLASALAAKWAEHGNTNCVPSPSLLVNGLYMLSADVMSEVGHGGLLEQMWANSDHAAIEAGAAVVPIAEALALLPAE